MKSWWLAACLALLSACGKTDLTADNTAATIDALRGQWVVINYWARWCKPCLHEIPELNRLNSSYDEITVLGVNYDGATGEELAEQVAQFGVEFVNLAEDPAALLKVPRPVVLPTTLILNPDGDVVRTLVGPQTLESLAEATLGVSPADKS